MKLCFFYIFPDEGTGHGHAESLQLLETGSQEDREKYNNNNQANDKQTSSIEGNREDDHIQESKGNDADHEQYENANQQESSEIKQDGNNLEKGNDSEHDNGDDKTSQIEGDGNNGDHNAYYVNEDSNEKPNGKINNAAEEAEGEDETNEEVVNEDGEGEESIRQQLVFAQGLLHPIPYAFLRGIRTVPLEQRHPKPFYPSPPDMSFGNVRHTVHDNIAVIGEEGSKLVPVKREMNIPYPILDVEPQTEASNIVELVSQSNDELGANIEIISAPPNLSAEGINLSLHF